MAWLPLPKSFLFSFNLLFLIYSVLTYICLSQWLVNMTRTCPSLDSWTSLVGRGIMIIARGRLYYVRWRRRCLPFTLVWSSLGGSRWLRLPRCLLYLGEGVLFHPPHRMLGGPLSGHSCSGCQYTLKHRRYKWGTRSAPGPKPFFWRAVEEDGPGMVEGYHSGTEITEEGLLGYWGEHYYNMLVI